MFQGIKKAVEWGNFSVARISILALQISGGYLRWPNISEKNFIFAGKESGMDTRHEIDRLYRIVFFLSGVIIFILIMLSIICFVFL
jgi:hypothetical protein